MGTHAQDSAARTALVIGATGGLGAEVARQLLAHGWQVRALTRHAEVAAGTAAAGAVPSGLQGVAWCLGDALNARDVLQAARGMRFIVHAANPPRYTRWRELALPMLAHAIEAARAVGARVVLPGNVYNFGPDAGACVDEASPQHPLTRKGAVRVEMEQMLPAAAHDMAHPVRSLVVRAGDFFGGHAPASWFQTLLVKPGRALTRVVYPGEPEVGHAWAYLPDLAATMLRLMELDVADPRALATCEVLHFGGHWLPRGIDMAEAVRRAAGVPGLPIRSMPWGVVRWLAPFVRVLREVQEMRYLWRVPLQLDNAKLRRLLGEEPHTPLEEAVRESLVGLGCLPSMPGGSAGRGPGAGQARLATR
ncbi:MAG: NAD(P)H-binding protein [Aquabacterium sp.]